ncbi:putative chemosensory protein [Operophtera brumata]|uniref:Putative chemosensory protein n=1 Tax=Operophtera brumata TaxID=104452 RepID=A0A0L7LDQ0_OPEBR|nr:putative chemosensory protein [Operophtera brumata]
MKGAILMCFLALAAAAVAAPHETYTSEYDNIDLQEVMDNRRLLLAYIKCCLGTGKCTPPATALKNNIGDAILTDCAKCTPTQQDKSKKMMSHLKNKEPELWSQLLAHYDPTGKHAARHAERLEALRKLSTNMKGVILACILALAAAASARPDEHYTDKYDNINVPEVLANVKLLHSYILCCLGKGKCTPEGTELKSRIKEAMENGCAKCTDVQLRGTKTVIRHLMKKEPAYWRELCDLYDPTGKYTKNIKMKAIVLVCVLCVATVALARPNEDSYTDKYDNINIEEILSNKALLGAYVKCILDLGKCTPDGKELKGHIREALENKCGKCTKAQEAGTRKVIAHFINHEPDSWKQLCDKYDPERKYVQKPNQTYPDRYDNINLDEIIGNGRLLVPYIKCVLDQGRCSPEGRELKSHIKEALETYCEKCTPTQRDGTRRVIGHLINHEAAYWSQLTAKYDPSRKYVQRYENDLKVVKAEG